MYSKPWLNYRLHLLPIIRKTQSRNNHFFADEIDDALLDERAFLFLAEDGFVVLQPTARNGLSWLNVMFAFNWGGNAITRYQSEIELKGRQMGARGVELFTAVPGLEQALLANGYVKTSGAARVQHWEKLL
ncbi:hypothetical protein E8E00_04905 [Salinivibrio sp. YCSC6]|nr:hypothetical protein B6G00_04045 [Salinivibrio sp. YCSC6]QCF37208.1 hypothetical protein E8E00_04905 [Salinivibrio sp. YCSC6]